MGKTVFLAGATGVVGRRLTPLLLEDGWRVCGTTRSPAKAAALHRAGIEPVVVDVFDGAALTGAVLMARPDVIVHQLTDLPPALDPARMAEATIANARLRDEGTRHLVAAAAKAGVARVVAQSVAFAYAEAGSPSCEDDALAIAAEGRPGVSARGVAALERHVLAGPFAGLVLRYGRLYGPGTGFADPAGRAPLHVDDAARAALLAMTRGAPGIYNIAQDDGTVSIAKAERHLGWVAGPAPSP